MPTHPCRCCSLKRPASYRYDRSERRAERDVVVREQRRERRQPADDVPDDPSRPRARRTTIATTTAINAAGYSMSTAQPAMNPAASARRTVGRRASRNAPSPSAHRGCMCPHIVAASGAASVAVPNVAPAAVPAPRITQPHREEDQETARGADDARPARPTGRALRVPLRPRLRDAERALVSRTPGLRRPTIPRCLVRVRLPVVDRLVDRQAARNLERPTQRDRPRELEPGPILRAGGVDHGERSERDEDEHRARRPAVHRPTNTSTRRLPPRYVEIRADGRLARHAVPARPDLGRRRARTSRSSRRTPSASSSASSTSDDNETADRAHRAHCVQLARLPPRRRSRPALRLPRPRPVRPARGHRFNPHKLLIDPYAKAIEGPIAWDAANALPYAPSGDEDADLVLDDEDDARARFRSAS